jgi:AcrR family transcriptional regulator
VETRTTRQGEGPGRARRPRKALPRRRVGRPGNGEDVRAAILAATLRQLEATGSPHRVTVATIVEEAGCTPPSLYHYWPKRDLLLQEASARGWAQFRASQDSAVADQRDPIERLRLRVVAYLQFAQARPALFRVLFLDSGPTQPVQTTRPTEQSPQPGEALNDLVADVSEAMAAGQLRPGEALATALALWSSMHGVAALWVVTPALPNELAHDVGHLAQDAVLRGLSL